jgi:hypothetical protein
MLLTDFFGWWYGRGWGQIIASLGRRLGATAANFSVGQLLKTLFSPWRRIITYPGASFQARFRAWGDNLFSRIIGFFVRFFVLIGAAATLAVIAVLSLAEIIIWPLLPLAVVAFIVKGVTGG